MAGKPVPATMVPHASETIALVVGALLDRLGGEVEITNEDLVLDRGRVIFTESVARSSVMVRLERD